MSWPWMGNQVSPCLGSFEAWGWWEATRWPSTQTEQTGKAGESSPLTKADFSDTASAYPCLDVPAYPYCLTANGRGVRSNADLKCGRR